MASNSAIEKSSAVGTLDLLYCLCAGDDGCQLVVVVAVLSRSERGGLKDGLALMLENFIHKATWRDKSAPGSENSCMCETPER